MPLRPPPPSAMTVEQDTDTAKLFAPSAARNGPVLLDLLRNVAPREGRALELASGTGQHIVRFAAAMPGLIWVPTELDEDRLASVRAYVMEAQLPNLGMPISLDACAPGWSGTTGPVDLITLTNLTHLVSAQEVQTLLGEVGQALSETGRFVLYGPFKRDGALTSEGDVSFDASLRAGDPEIGYKDTREIEEWAAVSGLTILERHEMPANNLAFVFGKASQSN